MINTYRPQRAKIEKIKELGGNSRLFELRLLEKNPLTPDGAHCFVPGQFCELWIPQYGEFPVGYASSPKQTEAFEVCVRKVGRVTGALFEKKVGDTIGVRGPLGMGTFPVALTRKRPVVLVAGGIGIFPLRSLILDAVESKKYKELHLFYGARDAQSLLFADEYEAWKKGAELNLTLDHCACPDEKVCGITCDQGLIPDLIKKHGVPKNALAIMVGPPVMYEPTVAVLNKLGMKNEDIYVSLERRMHCGLGVCQHCAVGSKYVCKEGPVFRWSEVVGYRL